MPVYIIEIYESKLNKTLKFKPRWDHPPRSELEHAILSPRGRWYITTKRINSTDRVCENAKFIPMTHFQSEVKSLADINIDSNW